MYQKKAAVFLYCVSPVHMGAGSATGVVDNPIQREAHTGHPSFAGSGIKGAVRHGFELLAGEGARDKAEAIFGSNTRAGAASFGDAQLVLFPVRSTRHGYVYATSSQALARAARLLALLGLELDWRVPDVAEGQALLGEQGKAELAGGGKLDLEFFQYTAQASAAVEAVASWLADKALPTDGGYGYFRDKIRRHMVVLSDTDFSYFVQNATLVEPHVRINEETVTADEGGLFYTENLPPESLLIAPLFASAERGSEGMTAEQVMGHLRTALDKKAMQLGGDATTGRGLVVMTLVEG